MIAAAALLAVIPVIFSLKLVDFETAAVIGERFLAVLGILLISHIGNIEENFDACDIVYSRTAPHVYTFVLRLMLAISVTFLSIGLIVLTAKASGGTFPLWEIWTGTFISALLLGFFGMTVSSISKSHVSGYLLSFAYFMFEWFTAGRYTGRFYLMSLLENNFPGKLNLLLPVLFLALLNIWIAAKKD